MVYELWDKQIPIEFNMFLMEPFWIKADELGTDLMGSDYLAILVYYGNRAHVKTHGGTNMFKTIQEVYQLILNDPNPKDGVKLIEDFQESMPYKNAVNAIEKATTEAKKKSQSKK